ncbi:MAG: ATP-binding protein [Spirochaetaceae bacterium]|jgi:sigma-B regulation protein RsbU (phosphoserine phosphatase)|nr:ATP-binding protein [Spirochaetaceae bacterium]
MSASFEYEITLSVSLSELDRLQTWVEGHLPSPDCPEKVRSQIAIVTEEVFVNLIRYAYGGKPGTAVIRLSLRDREAVLQFEDAGAGFNPLEYPIPDINADITKRTVGGLGIHLTKTLSDEVVYSRTAGRNLLTVYKRW